MISTEKREILGVEIWMCTRDEANEIARTNRPEAWRIWLHEEVDSHTLSSPEELQEVIDQKRAKPGPYFKKKGE